MTKFDMDVNQNFASFKLKDKMLFVESFDDLNFAIRVGSSEESKHIANIEAKSSDELNSKLKSLVESM